MTAIAQQTTIPKYFCITITSSSGVTTVEAAAQLLGGETFSDKKIYGKHNVTLLDVFASFGVSPDSLGTMHRMVLSMCILPSPCEISARKGENVGEIILLLSAGKEEKKKTWSKTYDTPNLSAADLAVLLSWVGSARDFCRNA